MAAGRWLCLKGSQIVRVVHGDGQVLTFSPPVKVADVLVDHPHHYICYMSPELPSSKSPMLSLDYELDPGCVYFLLPLPRLFPTSSAPPPACCCHSHNKDMSLEEGHTTPVREECDSPKFGLSPLRFKAMQHVMERIGSPRRGNGKKKVSPELSRSPSQTCGSSPGSSSGNTPEFCRSPSRNFCPGSSKHETVTAPLLLSPSYGRQRSKRSGDGAEDLKWFSGRKGCSSPSRVKKCGVSPTKNSPMAESKKSSKSKHLEAGVGGSMREHCRSFMAEMEERCCKWRPKVECISETETFALAGECLDRRILTFDSKPRPNSNLRLAEVFGIPQNRLQGGDRVF